MLRVLWQAFSLAMRRLPEKSRTFVLHYGHSKQTPAIAAAGQIKYNAFKVLKESNDAFSVIKMFSFSVAVSLFAFAFASGLYLRAD